MKIKTPSTNIKTNNQGYALLFAVLVSAVVLGVGVSILNIARKEILLTSGAEQSQYAFYAADAGYECAIYQDVSNAAFTSTSATGGTFSLGPSSCGATYIGSTPTAYSPGVIMTPINVGGVGVSEFQFTFNVPVSSNGSCAAVTLTKTYTVVTSTTTTVATQILSDGFNVGWEGTVNGAIYYDCNAANPQKVERALLASY